MLKLEKISPLELTPSEWIANQREKMNPPNEKSMPKMKRKSEREKKTYERKLQHKSDDELLAISINYFQILLVCRFAYYYALVVSGKWSSAATFNSFWRCVVAMNGTRCENWENAEGEQAEPANAWEGSEKKSAESLIENDKTGFQ